MCNTDEVRRVKETTAELFREQRALVERLNAMNERIEAENHPVRKVLRKVKWMEEKDRSVELLGKIVVSLQGVLEADAASDEMEADAIDEGALASAPSHTKASSNQDPRPAHPRAFSKIFRGKKSTDAVAVNRMHAELLTMYTASLAQGSIRIANPQALREPPEAPQQLSRWATWRDDAAKRSAPSTPSHATPNTTPKHQNDTTNHTLSTPTSRRSEDESFFSARPSNTGRTWSVPDVSKLVRQTFSKKMDRMLTSVRAWSRRRSMEEEEDRLRPPLSF
ncbi:hypothetical protein T484DRAFT_2027355 [Baffinella frigidus]|nr:hypothetical protein T484DRAFT_2027355 [Cryptophyta sp. CCMP2293]